MSLSMLPALNALLNATSAALIVIGWRRIRAKRRNAHRDAMLAAVVTSSLFLASYLYYHFHAGTTRFTAGGGARAFYFTVLLSHTVLAAVVPFLVATALYFAFRQRFETHRRIARWTLPIWMYVSVTGVVIYVMLYHLYPPAA
jgi:uncharacterized membrane protein YozB (DUF420 family)